MKPATLIFLLLFCFTGCDTYQTMLGEYNENFVVEVGTKKRPLIGEPGFVQEDMIPYLSYLVKKGVNFQLEVPAAAASAGITTYKWTVEADGTALNLEIRPGDSEKRVFVIQTSDSRLLPGRTYIVKITARNTNATYIDSTELVIYGE